MTGAQLLAPGRELTLMAWFKVDDGFHSHPKVTATSLAARGLWACAGSWSSHYLTGGVVPDHALATFGGTPELADELVAAGLWRRVRGGYRFHDWDGYQPDAIAEKERKAIAGSIGNHRRWHEQRGRFDPRCGYCLEKQLSLADRRCDSPAIASANPPGIAPYPYPNP